MNFKVLIAATLAALISIAASAKDPLPEGWYKTGGEPAASRCKAYADSNIVSHGGRSLTLHCEKSENGFITVMQNFSAENYQGKRIRMSASVKAVKVLGWSGLWMRVDSGHGHSTAFDNMQGRAIKGTQDWKRYEVVLDVDSDSREIFLGALLNGEGQIWMDDIKFEVVDSSVPVTNMKTRTSKAPKNLSLN